MQTAFFSASERGKKNIGWLESNFYFSFSDYKHPLKKSFGLLHTLNDDVVKKGGGFGLHPHTNMEIISVLLQGQMNHKDTLGYSDTVSADWVQIMSAGSGLKHEEYNVGEEDVHFLQIWIEPKLQNISPRYQKRYFPKSAMVNQLTTIVSNKEGTKHCWINQNAQLQLGYYTEATTLTYSITEENKCVFLLVIDGQIEAHNQLLKTKDALGIWEADQFSFAVSPNTHFLIIEVPINH